VSGAVVGERGEVLWTPSPERRAATRLAAFDAWVRARHEVAGEGYDGLWRWSVEHPDRFWTAVLDHFGVPAEGDRAVVVEGRMPSARWFPGLRLNYAEALLGAVGDDAHAVTSVDEAGTRSVTTGAELRRQVAAAAGGLRALGVGPGDRVAAYLPNRPEAIVAMLGAASIGAVWSCCAPDFGAGATLDRLAQIDPTVLVAVDGYRFGGRHFDRRAVVDEVRAGLPGLRATVGLGDVGDLSWSELLATGAPAAPERVPFSHPLWIVYTSGTTGPPKAIVQGHGGILLEHLKALGLHYDLGVGNRFFQHTSTG
jgi:acetoacetyl-CoA synthetase